MTKTAEAEKVTYLTAVDCDGPIAETPKRTDWGRRFSKLGLKPRHDAIEGISFLQSQPDVNLAGIYTARPGILHKEQTRRQLKRWGIPVDRVVHTSNSSLKKVKIFLSEVHKARQEDENVQGVLIDDNEARIVNATQRIIAKDPVLGPVAQEALTIVVFDSQKTGEQRTGGADCTIGPRVIYMKDWSKKHRENAFREIRTSTA